MITVTAFRDGKKVASLETEDREEATQYVAEWQRCADLVTVISGSTIQHFHNPRPSKVPATGADIAKTIALMVPNEAPDAQRAKALITTIFGANPGEEELRKFRAALHRKGNQYA